MVLPLIISEAMFCQPNTLYSPITSLSQSALLPLFLCDAKAIRIRECATFILQESCNVVFG